MAKMKEMSVVAEEACGWPNLTRLPNGEVICVYFNAPSHGLEEGDLVCAVSDDGGLNWKARGVVAPHPEGGKDPFGDYERSLDAVGATSEELDRFYSKNYEDYLGL